MSKNIERSKLREVREVSPRFSQMAKSILRSHAAFELRKPVQIRRAHFLFNALNFALGSHAFTSDSWLAS